MGEAASHATLLGVGSDNCLYTKEGVGDGSRWKQENEGLGAIAVTVMPNGVILGARADHKLYTMATLTSDWSELDGGGNSVPGDDV